MKTTLSWRPIDEIHEDYGPCVLVNMADPGYMEIGSNLNVEFDAGRGGRISCQYRH